MKRNRLTAIVLPILSAFLFLNSASLIAADFGPFDASDLTVKAANRKVESYRIWPDLAPGEKENRPDGENAQKDPVARIHDVTCPSIMVFRPANGEGSVPATDKCMIIFPGGGYSILAYDHEGIRVADFLTSQGITCVVLKYRVPSRHFEGYQFYTAAFQDGQRTVSFVRAHAKEWGINPEKIGVMGFSAGGNLTMLVATNGLTRSYAPIDEIDQTPCYVNFAAPVYPWRLLKGDYDKNKGNSCMENGQFKDDIFCDYLAFDAKTPPMCFIHGDADGISAMGSLAVYHKLRTMGISAEVHSYAKVGHGFGMSPWTNDFGKDPQDKHLGTWIEVVNQWLKKL